MTTGVKLPMSNRREGRTRLDIGGRKVEDRREDRTANNCSDEGW